MIMFQLSKRNHQTSTHKIDQNIIIDFTMFVQMYKGMGDFVNSCSVWTMWASEENRQVFVKGHKLQRTQHRGLGLDL